MLQQVNPALCNIQMTNDRLCARLLVSLYHQADVRRAQAKEDVHATCLESQGKTQRVER
jgi:hypothetical protein